MLPCSCKRNKNMTHHALRFHQKREAAHPFPRLCPILFGHEARGKIRISCLRTNRVFADENEPNTYISANQGNLDNQTRHHCQPAQPPSPHLDHLFEVQALRADHERESTNQLGNEPILHQIRRLSLQQPVRLPCFTAAAMMGEKTKRASVHHFRARVPHVLSIDGRG